MSITDPLIGKKLGDYNIEGILGTGGMARVYRGYDDNLDRYAAIKVIEPQLIASTEEDEYRDRFLREARAIARLNHPNIVSIYQFNQIGTLYYIAMEYAEGDNLHDILKGYIRQGRIMPTTELLAVLTDIANALDYAHQQNIIHRDIKPSNIIVTKAQGAVLTDFGLALNAMEGTIGNTFGSVHYIAPEQAISSANSVPQSDQYSLGIVAYELLTGRVPFDDASAMSVALKHISDPPPPPTELNPNVPAEVEQVLLRALDKEPDKRFPTAKEFVRSMELAFNMMDNADIEAPKTLTEALGAPPETKAFAPDEDSIPDISEASRPSVKSLEETEQRGINMFIVFGTIVVFIIIAGLFIFAALSEQNAQSTETAIAQLNIDNETVTTQAQNNALATDAQSTNDAITLASNQTETEQAIQNQTETQSADLTEQANETATVEQMALLTENALATETVVTILTMTANAPTERPTNTATMLPTETATERPTTTPTLTNTPMPTATNTLVPTATNTPRPTNTPTPEFFIPLNDDNDTRQVLLRYDGRSLVLSNRDREETLNLGDIRFVLFVPDEEGVIRQRIVFDLNNSALEDNAREMTPERCLQLLDREQFNGLPSPNDLAEDVCDASPFWLATSRPFWINENPEAYFEVRLGPVDVIGECQVQRPFTRTEKRCALDMNLLP